MKKKIPCNLRVPVLFVDSVLNTDDRLVTEVFNAGALGIAEGRTPDVPHGIRMPLTSLREFRPNSFTQLVLIRFEDADAVCHLEKSELQQFPFPVFVEVGSATQACGAEKAGASGLIAKGYEAPGWVSETNGLVLLQEILAVCDLPVFLQGGIGIHTTTGAIAAGASGVVLDVQLLLTKESGVNDDLKVFFRSLSAPATTTLAESCGSPCRVYSRLGTRVVKEFRKLEESLTEDSHESFRHRIAARLTENVSSPDTGEALLAISEDILIAKHLADSFGSAAAILTMFSEVIEHPEKQWPFEESSRVCKLHTTRFPMVQGPMAHVSDNPDFLAEVSRGGALPFLALGNMPAPIAREAMDEARQKTDGHFGVGLIGLEVNRHCYEAHLEIMKESPPPFAILAAGSVELAKRIEDQGTICYLHCPASTIVKEGLKAGLRHFVFEGCESGGHIGTLSSLNLWSANLIELERASADGLSLAEVTILFAGGIATGRAAAFVAGMTADLVTKGLSVGLQMGTAYLVTNEAVSTGAITSTYQKLTVDSDRTVVIGRSVNTKARSAASPMAMNIMNREQERIRQGVPLRDRKALYENDNLGALRLASKGCAIDPTTSNWERPMFCDLSSEEQLDRGLYLMGQAVSLLPSATTIEQLHTEIIQEGRAIFEQNQEPVAEVFEPDSQHLETLSETYG